MLNVYLVHNQNSTESLFRDNAALLNLTTQRRVNVKQYGTVMQPYTYLKLDIQYFILHLIMVAIKSINSWVT